MLDAPDSYTNNHREEGIYYANARLEVIICGKPRPSDCFLKFNDYSSSEHNKKQLECIL